MMPLYMSVKVRQTTTRGTTCPTLYEECVGSLTSHRFITCARACETGPTVYRPYPRLRKGLRINLNPQGSFATFLSLGNANAYFFTIVLKGGFKGGKWTPQTDIESNFAKLSAKPFFSTAFNFWTSGSGIPLGCLVGRTRNMPTVDLLGFSCAAYIRHFDRWLRRPFTFLLGNHYHQY